jgi:molecular chaperone DnaK (HSP70)
MGKVAINIATGSLQTEDIIVGIDLGTTNSLIAIVRSDTKQPIALKETDGLALVPSLMSMAIHRWVVQHARSYSLSLSAPYTL